jgi:hypothetical protein
MSPHCTHWTDGSEECCICGNKGAMRDMMWEECDYR